MAAGNVDRLAGLVGVDDVAVEVVGQLELTSGCRRAVVTGDDRQRRDLARRVGPRCEVVVRAAVGEHVARVRTAGEAVAGVRGLHVGALGKAGGDVPLRQRGALGQRASAGARLARGGDAVAGRDRRLTAAVGGADAAQQQAGRAETRLRHQLPDGVLLDSGSRGTPSGHERGLAGDAGRRDGRERPGYVVRGARLDARRVGSIAGEHEVVDPQRVAVLPLRVTVRDELVLERRGMHDQDAGAGRARLGLRDRVAGPGPDVLERVLRKLLLKTGLDHVRNQPGVAQIARTDHGQGRRRIGTRQCGSDHHDRRRGEAQDRGQDGPSSPDSTPYLARPSETAARVQRFKHSSNI